MSKSGNKAGLKEVLREAILLSYSGKITYHSEAPYLRECLRALRDLPTKKAIEKIEEVSAEYTTKFGGAL